MSIESSSRDDLIEELGEARRRISELEGAEAERQKAERDLHKFRRMLQLVLDSVPVRVFWKDRNSIYLGCNQVFAKDAGINSPDQIVGKTDYELAWKREEADFFRECDRRVMESDLAEYHIIEPQLQADGAQAWLDTNKVPLHDSEGRVVGILGTYEDITFRMEAAEALQQSHQELERRVAERTRELQRANEDLKKEILERSRAEDALRENEERYRAIVNNAAIGIDVVGKDGRFLQANATLQKMLGYTQEELLRRSILDVTHPDDLDVSRNSLEALVRGEIDTYRLEKRYVRKDGGVFWADLAVSGIRTPAGKHLATIGVIVDLTDRKRAEEALRSSEERFRAIFEGAQDCIFIKDSSLRYTQVNPATERLFGLKASEILGRRAEDLVGAEAGRHVREVDLRVLDGESVEEERVLPVNGVPMTFHEIRVPLRGPTGEIIGICSISRDITERKRVAPVSPVTPTDYPSKAMRATLDKARYAAATDSIVLLTGESGSGKDYLAGWMHERSQRANGPFFAVNCAAIPRELAESELFGHEAGAFTGAHGRKKGLLELAEGGTLLLNEIGELPLALQAKLLTFLDTRSFLRVGGQTSVRINARLIAATHRDLEKEIAEQRFLQPLFYRLNVFCISVPPLRERVEDIPILVEETLSKLAVEMQLDALPTVDSGVITTLSRYHWPGNIRELRNVLERALMVSHGSQLTVSLPSSPPSPEDCLYKVRLSNDRTLHDVTDEAIKSLCEEALRRTGGAKKEAAKILGISRDSLYRYMKRLTVE